LTRFLQEGLIASVFVVCSADAWIKGLRGFKVLGKKDCVFFFKIDTRIT
jgi:hypothetical protein